MGKLKASLPEDWHPGYGCEPDQPDHGEILLIDLIQAVDRYIAHAKAIQGYALANYDDAALSSDKLSHFLETTKKARAA